MFRCQQSLCIPDKDHPSLRCVKCLGALVTCPNSACREANLPFARYCRGCFQELPSEVIRNLGNLTIEHHHDRVNLEFKTHFLPIDQADQAHNSKRVPVIEITPVFDVSAFLDSADLPFLSVSLEASGGLVWLGLPRQGYVLVNPLAKLTTLRRPNGFGQKSSERPLRARVLGQWLLVSTNQRVIVEDLRAIDIGVEDTAEVALEYVVESGHEICSQPLLYSIAVTAENRLAPCVGVAWLERDAKGAIRLLRSMVGPLQTPYAVEKLALPDHSLIDDNSLASLICVNVDAMAFAVITPRAMGVLEGPIGATTYRPLTLPDDWECVGSQYDIVCAAAITEPAESLTLGRIAVGLQNGKGSCDLGIVHVPRGKSASVGTTKRFSEVALRGRPVGVTPDGQRVIVVSDTEVKLVNKLGTPDVLLTDGAMASLYAVRVYGRVGMFLSQDGPNRWVTNFIDLRSGKQINRISEANLLSTFVGDRWLSIERTDQTQMIVSRQLVPTASSASN